MKSISKSMEILIFEGACRTVCGDDCTAVTAVKKSEESFSCYVTTDHLTDLSLSEGSGASTYFKGNKFYVTSNIFYVRMRRILYNSDKIDILCLVYQYF